LFLVLYHNDAYKAGHAVVLGAHIRVLVLDEAFDPQPAIDQLEDLLEYQLKVVHVVVEQPVLVISARLGNLGRNQLAAAVELGPVVDFDLGQDVFEFEHLLLEELFFAARAGLLLEDAEEVLLEFGLPHADILVDAVDQTLALDFEVHDGVVLEEFDLVEERQLVVNRVDRDLRVRVAHLVALLKLGKRNQAQHQVEALPEEVLLERVLVLLVEDRDEHVLGLDVAVFEVGGRVASLRLLRVEVRVRVGVHEVVELPVVHGVHTDDLALIHLEFTFGVEHAAKVVVDSGEVGVKKLFVVLLQLLLLNAEVQHIVVGEFLLADLGVLHEGVLEFPLLS